MERWMNPSRGILIGVLAGVIALAGCMPHVVYTPSSVVSEKPVLNLRIAVQPFKDGTEDPRPRKMFMIPAIFMKSTDFFNAARPMGNYAAIVPPELWSKSMAAELRHQGLFTEVQHGQDTGEAPPDILLEGTLKKAELEQRIAMVVIFPVYIAGRQDYAFSLRALRAGDRKVLWTGTVERSIPKVMSTSGDPFAALMQSMLLEAAQNLVKGLQSASAELQSAPAASAPATGTSVEDILKSIGGR
jgi:hypothetical protein